MIEEVRIEKLKINPTLEAMSQEWDRNNDPDEIHDTSLRRSIEKNGVKQPLVVDRDYAILDGYRRYFIAMSLGIRHLKVVRTGD